MSQGEPLHQIGVYPSSSFSPLFDLIYLRYLPVEDNLILGVLPPELRNPGAFHYYEMRTVFVPYQKEDRKAIKIPLISARSSLEGYNPIWVTNRFLQDANYDAANHILHIGNTIVYALYVDCLWMDLDALKSIVRLAKSGLPVVVKNWTIAQPGVVKSDEFQVLLDTLKGILNVKNSFFLVFFNGYVYTPNVHSEVAQLGIPPPLLTSTTPSELPFFWPRKTGNKLTLFFAHPLCKYVPILLIFRS